uniref:Uncharacterized protein n=1 Tax=Tanacetum cinerariifolium TaxID=118510 RepID=A0A699UGW3_TANCI|nr:hypothetical protein [Tanacetum cinerariifolium]
MPLISVSFQAIAFFRVLRTLMRVVFSLELRSFAMITSHFPLSPRNAYSRIIIQKRFKNEDISFEVIISGINV